MCYVPTMFVDLLTIVMYDMNSRITLMHTHQLQPIGFPSEAPPPYSQPPPPGAPYPGGQGAPPQPSYPPGPPHHQGGQVHTSGAVYIVHVVCLPPMYMCV